MGVFLGYPLHDVKGFIEHGGDDFELSGYWKVYSDKKHAQELFERFDIVKDDMVRMISRGDSINSIVSYYQADEANVAV